MKALDAPLTEVAPRLWVTHRHLRMYGVELGTRMTIAQLRDGGLLLHSPVRLDAHLRAQLDALGPVRFVVAPNRWHHMFAGDYRAAYPEARVYAAPGLAAKRPDLKIDGTLDDAAPAGWASEIDQCFVRGVPIFNEVVLFHRASRSLITSDLVVHICEDSPPLTRFVFRLMRGYRKPGWTPIERRLFVKDRAALRGSVDHILTWDFDRVILAHGRMIDSGGTAALQAAFDWL